ncbi:hypothetical protein K3495_g3443 [Podosphaera aphanis]|nr:hypothetical protein K3495_g3443 [Podosphaera aphanis]
MAPTDSLSPAGSSTYSSNLMYVGDGTWDASRNTFLLPNLVGVNFEMMRYNGMGNRFRSFAQYHQIIISHGILAAITFLLLVPTAIFIAQFHSHSAFWATRLHIYIQITTILLSTAVFTLGWFAVGPARSFTNPHHGIGATIYLLVLLQALIGFFLHRRPQRKSIKKYIITYIAHQWTGRATALLGFAQVALGLTLYGSPKFLFVLHHLLNMTTGTKIVINGKLIEDQRTKRLGNFLGPVSFGAGTTALFHQLDHKDKSQSDSRTPKEKVVSARRHSRRRSESTINEKEYEGRHTKDEESGNTGKVLSIAGVTGLAKSWNNKKQKTEDDAASSDSDTPSKRHRRPRRDSVATYEKKISEKPLEDSQSKSSKLIPIARDPVATGALNHSEPRLSTLKPMHRRESYDSDSSLDDTTISRPHRQKKVPESQGKVFSLFGIGWLAKKMKNQTNLKDSERAKAQLIEDERRDRLRDTPSRLSRNRSPKSAFRIRRGSSTNSSDLSSDDDSRPGTKPDIPTSLIKKAISQSKSQQPDKAISNDEILSMPRLPQEPHRIPHQSSNTVSHIAPREKQERRNSSSRRREGETAAAAALLEAANLEAEEKRQRHSSRSRVIEHPSSASEGPRTPVSVKIQIPDKDHITLRRLTSAEAAAEKEVRKSNPRFKRAGSVSSISGFDTAVSNRRYRRSERDAERRSEPPVSLAPPSPAISRKPKDGAYYSGGLMSSGSNLLPTGTVGLGLDGHESWSVMSPSARGDNGDAAAERRRRRRQERSQRSVLGEEAEEKQGLGDVNQGDRLSFSNA